MQQWVRNNLPKILTLRTDRHAQALGLYVEIARFSLEDSSQELASIEVRMRSKVEHALRRVLESSQGEDGLPRQ